MDYISRRTIDLLYYPDILLSRSTTEKKMSDKVSNDNNTKANSKNNANNTNHLTDEQKKEYEKLKQDLKKSLKKRNALEDEFDKLNQEIYEKETEYLSNSTTGVTSYQSHGNQVKTHYWGNIVKGFEGFSKPHGHDSNNAFTKEDRIFSLSSIQYTKQPEALEK
ncbi:hypothetical protein TPHA_0B01470 [Tetrapisispora phaffii CBS 4417]|uniref:Chromatin modification-related protein EAF6 n=1 Tax=Tetrapisispora phaffii (strain ATCC 24235 / CBS 4417 / NBRC 1672 / NRRL Y-8282 / UCD 70-5) TaxID=1071381 RepID=G8BP89_TETPH|nr:hypothetical protein TPHA_0B01470 [Tetrapisispora phaffii CBS 4417]CCE61820.1 hypothetical protein TPHA_0B01470 [Tetrapisispora phaffii CBS 4417]